MGNTKSVATIQINGEAKNLLDTLAKLKSSFSKLDMPDALEKNFGKLEKILGSIIRQTKDGAMSQEDYKQVQKEIRGVKSEFGSLLETIDGINKLDDKKLKALIPQETISKINQAKDAFKAYAESVQELVKTEQDYAKAKKNAEDLGKTQESASKAKEAADVNAKQKKEELDKYKKITEAIQKQESAEKALRIAEKELEKASGMGEKAKNTRRQRVTNAKTALTKASNTVAGFSDQEITAQKKAQEDYNQALLDQKIAEKAVEKATEDLIEARNAEQIAELNLNQVKEKSTESTKKQEEALKTLKDALAKVNPKYKDLKLEGKTTSEQLEELSKKVDGLSEEELKKLKESLSQNNAELNNCQEATKKLGEAADETTKKIKAENEEEAKQDAIKDRIKQFVGWAGAAKVLHAALRNAFQDIKELDAVMSEIAVVTNFDIGDMWDQMPTYTQRANKLGLAITDIYKASALFYQQGLDTEEMMALSNQTLKMAKIAGLDAADATDRMTAALRGFNMALNEDSAERVADVYSKLAAITASNVDEISTAMTKTASIASSAGMEFETTAAFLSQIIETTRESAETAGTAMKTVIARFQELKKAPSEIEQVDGEVVDANQIESALRSVGVALRDASGEFRDLDDVFLELSSKWDTLDKNTQRYIATIAAGSRQQSRFIAMMQDYSRTQELVNAANNSAGASSEQYAKTLVSIETKLNRLDNAWTEFSTGIMNSDFVKFAVDFLTTLLQGLNKATQGFGSFTSSITKVGMLVAIFQTAKSLVSKFFDEIIQKVYSSAKKAGENIAQGTADGINQKKAQTSGEQVGVGKKITNAITSPVRNIASGAKAIFKKVDLKVYTNIANAEEKVRVAQAKLNNAQKEGIKDLTEYEEKLKIAKIGLEVAEKPLEERKKGFEQLTKGLQATGQALTVAGAGVSMLGNLLSNAGFEEAGETIGKLGSYITMFGTAVMGLAPIFSMVGKVVEKSGWAAMAPWIAFIAIAAAIIFAIVGIANAIKKNSPEYKMEKLAEASEKAKQAADDAKESYEGLVNALDGLDDGYKSLEKLTKGTKEWNDAVEKINSQVLDLIQQYPDLVGLAKNIDGVLTIDIESEEVQVIIKESQLGAIVAQNNAIAANTKLEEESQNLDYDKLSNNAKLTLTEEEKKEADNIKNAGAVQKFRSEKSEYYKERTMALARALVTGAIIDTGSKYDIKDKEKLSELGINESDLQEFYEQVGDSTNELMSFGQQLIQSDKQVAVEFEAAAQNARSLADTFSMSESEMKQASNLQDGARYKEIYNQIYSEFKGLTVNNTAGRNHGTAEQQQLVDEAIKSVYGSSAYIKGGRLYTIGEDEKATDSAIDNQQIWSIVANYAATKRVAESTEKTPEMVDNFVSTVGEIIGGDSLELQNAIRALLEDKTGGSLTQDQLDILTKNKDKIKQIAYLGGYEAFFGGNFVEDKILGAITNAGTSWGDLNNKATTLGVSLEDIGSLKNAKDYIAKMNKIYESTGKKGLEATQNAFTKLLDGKQIEEQEKIRDYVNSFDWSNANNLREMAYDLEKQFGYTKDKAEQFVDILGTMSQATGDIPESLRIYGDLFQAQQKLNQEMEKAKKLEWDYQKALRDGKSTKELMNLRSQQKESYKNQVEDAMDAYGAAIQKQNRDYQKGADIETYGMDLTELVDYNAETNTYDYTRLQEAIVAGKFGTDENSGTLKAVNDYIDKLQESNQTAKDQLDTARDSYDKLVEIEEGEKDDYLSLLDTIENAILTKLQDNIDIQNDLLEATEEANSKIVDKIQEQVDDAREARDREKELNNLTDLQKRLDYLQADTSGANVLEILDLQRQLQDDTQNYQDSLVDKAINDLQDANDKAYEQRQRQITLQEQQLELYKNSQALEGDVGKIFENTKIAYEKSITDGTPFNIQDTPLGNYLKNTGYFKGMNETEEADAWKNIENTFVGAYKYSTDKNGVSAGAGTGIDNAEIYNQAVSNLGELQKITGLDFTQLYTNGKITAEDINTAISEARKNSSIWTGRRKSYNYILNKYSEIMDVSSYTEEAYNSLLTDRQKEDLFGGLVEGNIYGKDWWFRDFSKKQVELKRQYEIIESHSKIKSFPSRKDYTMSLYETGGLNDTTGPAWLDGTKSKPEYVLNAEQTEWLFSLLDVLGAQSNDSTSQKGGDNYFDIDISVDQIDNDYDVEQMAEKIKRIIYDDASYRNVNTINITH